MGNWKEGARTLDPSGLDYDAIDCEPGPGRALAERTLTVQRRELFARMMTRRRRDISYGMPGTPVPAGINLPMIMFSFKP